MQPDPFAGRLATVRHRFASTLAAKISDACAALPQLSGNDIAVAEKLADTYRQIHGIGGIGSMVGFVATGKAARVAEDVLLPPFRAKRGLTDDEAENLRKELETLRAVAQFELQSVNHAA